LLIEVDPRFQCERERHRRNASAARSGAARTPSGTRHSPVRPEAAVELVHLVQDSALLSRLRDDGRSLELDFLRRNRTRPMLATTNLGHGRGTTTAARGGNRRRIAARTADVLSRAPATSPAARILTARRRAGSLGGLTT
jgi:hypothetical protein